MKAGINITEKTCVQAFNYLFFFFFISINLWIYELKQNAISVFFFLNWHWLNVYNVDWAANLESVFEILDDVAQK